MPGPLRGSPTVAFNSVYVMTQDNQIHALSTTDGSPIWDDAAASGQSGVFGVAAPAAGQGTVIAGYSTGELVAYRYENGRNLWSDALSRTSISTQVGTLTDVDADPIIDSGQVFALGQGGRMAAYELTTGQRIWELTLAGISTPTVAGDWIFTLTDDARLLAIARNTGRIRWITQLERWREPEDREGPIFWTGPVLASNRLWIASSQGEVRSVDVQTGEHTLFTELNDPVSLPPIVANNTLYILDDSGRITAWR
jgi:outer membrane protein assembly factor BamB